MNRLNLIYSIMVVDKKNYKKKIYLVKIELVIVVNFFLDSGK